MDSDDEVRDRATFYMNVLQQKQKALNAAYIFNGTTRDVSSEPHTSLYKGMNVFIYNVIIRLVFVLRFVCVRSWPGEVAPSVHTGAFREAVRHKDGSSGDSADHRAEDR